jgi:hypothetical protein
MPPGEEGDNSGTNRKGISSMESEEGVPPRAPEIREDVSSN